MAVWIEPVGLHHADRVQHLVEDPAVRATTSMPDPYPPDGARRYIEHAMRRREAGDVFVFAVITAGHGLVGLAGLTVVPDHAARAELGYWVGRPYWGCGFASTGVALAVRLGFEALGLAELVAYALADNAASRRVLEKTGFVFVGLGPHDVAKWSPARAVANYHLSRHLWEAGPVGAASPR